MATDQRDGEPSPEGVYSLLDTDLYKLTMQSAILHFFPQVPVAYAFTNRTPHMKLTRGAFLWLQRQVHRLGSIRVTEEEIAWLRRTCPYFKEDYLNYLRGFQLRPDEQVQISFVPSREDESHGDNNKDGDNESVPGELHIVVRGLWVETILYEIPLLALVSESYFRFVDRDWTYPKQLESARDKARTLLKNGCVFSEFGSRRRRDYRTHELVLRGILTAQQEADENNWPGKCSGTSNVHFAMRFGIPPVGTVAHEWFMGVAAIEDDYAGANEKSLRYWTRMFGRGVLAIALTDTFGTTAFLQAFSRPARDGIEVDEKNADDDDGATFAQIFTGVRQDSGDPLEFLQQMRKFYRDHGITERKTVVFSDSLDVEKCLQYKKATEEAGFTPSFGIGTFFTNDFVRTKTGKKSVPLNIVIKLSEANGRQTIKLSDDKGKHMGDGELVRKVKDVVGYTEREWAGGDEAHRWDR